MAVHATAKLDESIRNLRRLLKPGGFLVMGEGSSDGAPQAGAGFIFGTLLDDISISLLSDLH